MTAAQRFGYLDAASIARRAAEKALDRVFGARHQPALRWGGAKVRLKPKRKAPVAAAPVAAPPAERPRRQRTCSVCGEFGHRADNPRHRVAAAEPAPDVAPTPAPPSPPTAEEVVEAAPPRAAARAPKRVPVTSGPRRSFLPALPDPIASPPPEAADELDEGLAEGRREANDAGHADLEAPPAPSKERLRWTPGPAAEDEDQVPAVAALASGRWPNHRRSIPAKQQLRAEIRSPSLAVIEDEVIPRPLTRGDCENVPRPCPFVSCSHHLYLDVNEDTGTLKLNHPTKEPWELAETCALDVAEAAGATLEAVGELCGITRERVRQVEERALAKLRRSVPAAGEADSPGPAIRSYREEAA